jgi:hypothetical protein
MSRPKSFDKLQMDLCEAVHEARSFALGMKREEMNELEEYEKEDTSLSLYIDIAEDVLKAVVLKIETLADVVAKATLNMEEDMDDALHRRANANSNKDSSDDEWQESLYKMIEDNMIQAAKARLQLKKAIPFVPYLQLRIRKAAKAFDAWLGDVAAASQVVKPAVKAETAKPVVKAWSCPDDGNAHAWKHKGKLYARNFTNDVWNCERRGSGWWMTWAGVYLPEEDRIDETAAEPLYKDDVVTPCFDSMPWTCKMCTFINQPISRSCQMCNSDDCKYDK